MYVVLEEIWENLYVEDETLHCSLSHAAMFCDEAVLCRENKILHLTCALFTLTSLTPSLISSRLVVSMREMSAVLRAPKMRSQRKQKYSARGNEYVIKLGEGEGAMQDSICDQVPAELQHSQ